MAAESFQRKMGRLTQLDDLLLMRQQFGRDLEDLAGYFDRHGNHSVQIAVKQVSRINSESADLHWFAEIYHVCVGMRYRETRGKEMESGALNSR
jgi:hypothetical protein